MELELSHAIAFRPLILLPPAYPSVLVKHIESWMRKLDSYNITGWVRLEPCVLRKRTFEYSNFSIYPANRECWRYGSTTEGHGITKGQVNFMRHLSTYVLKFGLVWTTLITNTKYLEGLLTLDYSLKKHGSKYPLVALYTGAFPPEGHAVLEARGIPKRRTEYLLPKKGKDYSADPRFYDCWSKLTPFGLVEYDRVVQLDSDMLVLQNMDELMDLELDPPSLGGKGKRVFAAGHACVCNPLKKPHYPRNW